MATYLDLCQKVARESGTISGTLPTSVANQTGRLLLIVEQVADAWVEIQNARNAWRFMFQTWTGTLTANTACYAPASFGLTDLARWVTDAQEPEAISLYETSEGVSDEAPLYQVDYWTWRRTYGRGSQTASRPSVYAVSPSNELCFGPIPDTGYTVSGGYYRSTAQVLSDNADEPLCPARFHDVIAWRALVKLGGYDEAEWPVARAQREYQSMLRDLERDQLPAMTERAGPLA